MPKQKFVRVTIDTATYNKLTTLANTASLSRAEYIRRLIRNQLLKEYAVKHGVQVPTSDLDPIEKIINSAGTKFGVTVDLPFLRFVYDMLTGKGEPEELKEPETG